jgi:hypothetical protein
MNPGCTLDDRSSETQKEKKAKEKRIAPALKITPYPFPDVLKSLHPTPGFRPMLCLFVVVGAVAVATC